MAFSSTDKVQDFYVSNVIIPVIVLVLIAIVSILFKSIVWAIIVCCIYVTSSLYGLVILRYISVALVNLNVICNSPYPVYDTKDPCSVCSNNSCKRHKLLPHSTKVKVPKDFDHALEQFLEDLLQKYVCTWYSDFSTNEAFVQQLRLATATAAKNIAVRLLRTDASNVVFYRLIPLLLQHAQDWKMLHAKIRDNSDADNFGSRLLDYLGREVHPASYSRQAELNYLRGVVTAIVPHLLPAIHVSTNNKVILREILANWILLPAVDAIADPDNINTLVVLSTHRDGSASNQVATVNVPMLQCWISNPLPPKSTQSHLKPSLDEILNDPRLLYMFMQHIKETGPMSLFQFCLDIDDLSKRMLNPEMSSNAESSLYADIQNMYATYLDPEGPEYLHLPEDISMGIRRILERNSKKIEELRTSRPFYQAHQEAHALLESTCLPSFHHSYQLYDLFCGHPAPTTKTTKQQSPYATVTNSTNASKVGNHFSRIDGVLRTPAIDGMTYQDIYQCEEVDYPSRPYNEIKYNEDSFRRDLTTWRVSIPHIENTDNQILYVIVVHNIAEGKSWSVLRRDQDFYVLRTRLAEFHGDKELSDSPLPSRKNPHTSYAINKQRYEDFLEKLLSKPVLRSSESLYDFLTVPNLKPYFSNYSTPDIGILYQSMAYRLRKEKGQNLDKFLAVFLASTNNKSDYTDIGIEPAGETITNEREKKGRDLLFSVFGDNLHLDVNFRTLPSSSLERSHIKGASFCIADAVDRLLNVPPVIARTLWMLASSSRAKVDPYVNVVLYNTLVKLLSGGRAATVVKLLHAKVLGDKNRTRDTNTEATRRCYYEAARKGLHGLLPCWLIGFYKPWIELMDMLLNSLQNAPLNKHLAYVLLDQILVSLFPEITV